MEITAITSNNIEAFRPLMTQAAASMAVGGVALGLVDEQTACGALCGFMLGGDFNITSLYVAPDYRRLGGAALLLQAAEDMLGELPSARRIVACYDITREEQEPLTDLFISGGFSYEPVDGPGMRAITVGSLRGLPSLAGKKHNSAGVLPFSELPDYMLDAFDQKLGGVFDIPLSKADVDRDVSVGYVGKDGLAGILVFERNDDALSLAYTYSGASGDSSRIFSVMLGRAFVLVTAKYPPATRLFINAVTPLAAALVERVAGQADDFVNASRRAVKQLERSDIALLDLPAV